MDMEMPCQYPRMFRHGPHSSLWEGSNQRNHLSKRHPLLLCTQPTLPKPARMFGHMLFLFPTCRARHWKIMYGDCFMCWMFYTMWLFNQSCMIAFKHAKVQGKGVHCLEPGFSLSLSLLLFYPSLFLCVKPLGNRPCARACYVAKNGHKIWVYNTHMASGDEAGLEHVDPNEGVKKSRTLYHAFDGRTPNKKGKLKRYKSKGDVSAVLKAEIKDILSWIKETQENGTIAKEDSLILCGDFNARPTSETYGIMRKSGWKSAMVNTVSLLFPSLLFAKERNIERIQRARINHLSHGHFFFRR